MIVYSFAIEALQLLLLLLAAPAFAGWVRTVKCRMQGRSYAGIFQPYRDIARLFTKEVILAENASWIFRFTPYLVFGVTVMIGGIVPFISTDLPFAATADVIALVMLFAIIRFFTALAGMDIGTAFGGMGSSREMMIASLAEPAMLMAIFTVSLAGNSTSLTRMVQVMAHGEFVIRPSLAFALLAYIMVHLTETGRIPVDNPSTHLELTMIHEAMILEYSGRHLALIEWAGQMKLFIFSTLGIAVFCPWGIPASNDLLAIIGGGALLAVKLAVLGVILVLIETGMAKMRLFRLTEYLGSAFLLATLGMLSFFILE
ncbi:MAG: NADH-quinone oxidoreductase subunit H [Deltaproteobacteria bacterium]|nr:NADH-quinone oxidoreductase subunit H [Deltaproteobacteria bacterium]